MSPFITCFKQYILGFDHIERSEEVTQGPEATDLYCPSKTSTAAHEDASKTVKRVKYGS